MATEYKRINLLIGNAASLARVSEEGTPAIWSDTGYRLGWLVDGAWKLAAVRGSSETFSALTVTGLPANTVPRVNSGKALVSGSINDTGTAVTVSTPLLLPTLSNGFIPLVSTAGGQLGNSSLSEDAKSVKSAKSLTLNGATRPAWGDHIGTLSFGGAATLYAYSAFNSGSPTLSRNLYYDGANFRARVAPGATPDVPALIQLNAEGQLVFAASVSAPSVDGVISDLTEVFRVSKIGSPGFYGVATPTSRPTISGQRTATTTLAALYQALGATGLILDATTGTSVTREAIIQPLPITNSAPGTVTVVSGGMKSFGFDGNTITEELFYHCDVQHDYIAGGDLIFHVHWMPQNATGGNVKWQIEYQWVEAGATWPAPSTLAGTTAAGTTAWADKRTDFTIPGTGHTYDSRLMVRLFRNPTDAADTYTGDAVLSSVGMHYQADPGQP